MRGDISRSTQNLGPPEQSGEQPSTICRALHITMTQGEDPEVELESQDTHAFFYDFCYL